MSGVITSAWQEFASLSPVSRSVVAVVTGSAAWIALRFAFLLFSLASRLVSLLVPKRESLPKSDDGNISRCTGS